MQTQTLAGHDHGLGQGAVELDLCFACQGIWFDHRENLKLHPQAVVELFALLHQHRTDERRPLQHHLTCPRCVRPLSQGYDMVRSGRYMVYRCAQQHGRFSAFSSFMVEKGFVRHLTRAEVQDLARRVDAIYCTGCGAPVDIRKDHACPHCRAAFSLIDPEAVSKALEGYARTRATGETGSPVDIADALIVIERDRNRAERERQQQGLRSMGQSASSHELTGDLLAAGVELVWRTLFR
jgi:hypothetical protein